MLINRSPLHSYVLPLTMMSAAFTSVNTHTHCPFPAAVLSHLQVETNDDPVVNQLCDTGCINNIYILTFNNWFITAGAGSGHQVTEAHRCSGAALHHQQTGTRCGCLITETDKLP